MLLVGEDEKQRKVWDNNKYIKKVPLFANMFITLALNK
jgi:hypothetical protein